MYQVRLENAYVRVLEYHSEPGEKEAMHFHPPGAVYSLSDGTVRVRIGKGIQRSFICMLARSPGGITGGTLPRIPETRRFMC